jgi:hypothetical protein
MADIVKRLRTGWEDISYDDLVGMADEAADEIERLRAYLLGIAQGTNEEWTHDWALRAIETSDPFEQPKASEDLAATQEQPRFGDKP